MARDSLEAEGRKMGQDDIQHSLMTERSFLKLKSSIKEHKGAMVPIWICPKGEKFVVVEGNSRLLSYKLLKEENPNEKYYNDINCFILPKEINDEDRDFIRLISHLHGHTDWDKYERSKYLYILYADKKYGIDDLAKVVKLSKMEVKEDIEAYTIMTEQFIKRYEDVDFIGKWSYFKEFVKNKKLRNVMETLKLTDKDFATWIYENKLERAQDVRKLADILRNPNTREMFLKKDFARALVVLKDVIPEKSEKIYIKMKDLSEKFDKINVSEYKEMFKDHGNPKRKVFMELFEKMRDLVKRFG